MPEPVADVPPRPRAAFALRLALVVGLALAARAVYVLFVTRHVALGADATWYYLQGGLLRHGIGYVDPRTFFSEGRAVATGAWPPLYPGYLSLVIRWIGDSETTMRLAGLLPAAATVALTGVLARRVFNDDTVALVGALIVALSPFAIANDMSLMSETLSVPFTLLVLLAGHAIIRQPTRAAGYVVYGVVTGIATLARSDILLTAIVVLVVAVVASTDAATRRIVATRAVVALVIAGAVLVPWSLRNHARVGTFSITTTSFATAIAGSNCADTYGTRALGSWSFACTYFEERTNDNEVEWSNRIARRGASYAVHHVPRWPGVVAARVLREWGVWGPAQQARTEAVETRRFGWQLAAWIVELPILVLAAIALVRLRKNWREIAVLVAALVAVTLTAVITYGNQRFRAPAEPALAILAAWALCSFARGRSWQHAAPQRQGASA
jgi:uncharacterized membrane protein